MLPKGRFPAADWLAYTASQGDAIGVRLSTTLRVAVSFGVGKSLVRLDKWTWVIGGLAVAAAVVLGALAAAWAGVLAALAGLVPAVLWQAAANRRSRLAARNGILNEARVALVPPGPAEAEKVPGGVARYLRPEEAVVEFWPRPELGALRGWLVSDRPADVQLVTGEGGAGKTRLALQLAREATEEYGFRCYWAQHGTESQTVTAVRQDISPVLIVLDYAETFADMPGLLAQLTAAPLPGEPSPQVRVLLLARSAGEWWDQLVASSSTRLGEALAAISPLALGAITEPTRQREVFEQAVMAFAARLGRPRPSGSRPPAFRPDAVILVVHAAALVSVLDHHSPDSTDQAGDAAAVIGRLLLHEARYWQQSQAQYGLSLGPALTRRVVAAGTLVGADDESSAVQMLSAIDDLGDAGVRGRTARWLHDLYPATGPGRAPAEWIGPLRPDLVAEHLVMSVFSEQPALVRALPAVLPEYRTGRVMRWVARQVDGILSQANPEELATAVREWRPALFQSFEAAARDTNQRWDAAAEKLGMSFSPPPSHGLPAWLRISFSETLLTWGNGSGRTCIHDPLMTSFKPVVSAAWKRYMVVCPECTHLLTIRGGKGSQEDNTCDACGHVARGTGDDIIQPGAVTIGPMTYMFGCCGSCGKELEPTTDQKSGGSSPSERALLGPG